jgi:hypothetical protein
VLLGVEAVVVVVVVIVVVAWVVGVELELGVDERCEVAPPDDPLAGADDRDELAVLEPPPVAIAYATAAPSRNSAITARKPQGARLGGRPGGSGRVAAVGAGVASCGTVARCGTSAAAATAVRISAAGNGFVGSVAIS